jgi:uncharacterized membrane protein
MRDISWMAIVTRLLISLLAGGIALVATFKIVYRIGLADAASSPYDAQGPIGAVFGAAFYAPVVALATIALIFWLSRKWF